MQNLQFALRSALLVLLICIPGIIRAEVENEIYFTADLTDILGTGLGFFDPLQDQLDLMGLDWVGATVVEDASERRFEEDPFNPGIFFTIMTIRGEQGDSTKWKCKAEPEDHFFNWGWEISPDYWYTIEEDGHIAEVELKPNIFPIQPAIEEAVSMLFQVDMNRAVNYYTQEDIYPEEVEWVGLKGQNSVLGAWAGSWVPADTLSDNKTLHVLRDNGRNGDKAAGDYIFSTVVEFPAGNEGGPGLFKYGAYYEGALEVNNGQNPLDNEMHGMDHWINIKVGGQTEILNRFGVIEGLTEVNVANKKNKTPETISLDQNYPNPFNPATTIRFTLNKPSHVDLAIFNLNGRQVALLLNEQKSAGSHAVKFDASFLSSGIYLYQLRADQRSIFKKMILAR